MNINEYILEIKSEKKFNEKVNFEQTIKIIDENYEFSITSFKNGDFINEENQNNNSCKIFAFAKENNLTKEQTLNCFGNFYRIDVLENPNENNHQNIRNFMKFGWEGIRFEANPLKLKK